MANKLQPSMSTKAGGEANMSSRPAPADMGIDVSSRKS